MKRSQPKKILITGQHSYIGESFKVYAEKNYPFNFQIDTLDVHGDYWRKQDFSLYDCVFHVAGLAHADVGYVSEETKKEYYKVNTDLAIDTAAKAKAEKVGQFIFMSSMIIYGGSCGYGEKKVIDSYTMPEPANFYGDSKWQADKRIRSMADDSFRVAVLRPPMIYGSGSKGNYPRLAKLARLLPIFPDIDNERSMLYIDHLCEFLCQLMLRGDGGIYFPQNAEYSSTSRMVQEISKVHGSGLICTKLLNPLVLLAAIFPGKIGRLANKAFGNMVYARELSVYEGINYQLYDLPETIQRTEKNSCQHLLVVSQYFHPEQFRINDMTREWVRRGYKVTVLTGIPNYPMGKYFAGYGLFKHRRENWHGVEIIRIPLVPRGQSRIGMAANYLSFVASGFCWSMIANVCADKVFIFEVSPMTQALVGIWYSLRRRIPCYLYVQDLWPENVEIVGGVHNKTVLGLISRMVNYIYGHCERIFATSPSFVREIQKRCRDKDKVSYWPQYAETFYQPVSKETARQNVQEIPADDSFKIIFTGSIGKAQGLDILPRAAGMLDDTEIKFVIVGDGREQAAFEKEVAGLGVSDRFIMTGRQPTSRIPYFLGCCDVAFVSFSDNEIFRQTIPAKMQSYMACGMPILASAAGETARIVEEAQCGLCSAIGDAEDLVRAIRQMKAMPGDRLRQMGLNSRNYCRQHFSKQLLMDEMDEILKG